MKIAVFGSNGMAGYTITKYLRRQNISVTTIAKSAADIICNVEQFDQIDDTLARLNDYDFVINCIGLLVKESIDRPDRAAIINSWFPHKLEYHFKNLKTRIVHLSTDCVFNGSIGYYREHDVHTEMNAYGSSKSLGEINNTKDITFRMSIIGPEIRNNPSGLLHWILDNKQNNLPGWDNAMWNGITTLQLAKSIEKYIKSPTISGVYHLVSNANSISKYELLNLINRVYGLEKNIIKTQSPKSINKILVDTRNEFEFNIPDYTTMIQEMKNFHLI